MKKTFLSLSVIAVLIIVACGMLQAQQSDRELIKAANNSLKDKDYDQAFKTITTVAKPKDSKVQDILKTAYPNLIVAIYKKTTTVKITDKDDDNSKIDKYGQILSMLEEASDDDALLKKTAEAGLYKTLSKQKKIDGSIASFNIKVKALKDKQAQRETAKADSIKADSIAKVAKIKHVDTTANKQVVKENPKTTTTETPTNVTPETENTNVNTTTQVTTSGKKYYIITGSYATTADAQAIVDKLKAQGYGAEITGKNGYGNYRVSYNSYTNQADALKELEKIRKIQADAWLLEQ